MGAEKGYRKEPTKYKKRETRETRGVGRYVDSVGVVCLEH